LQVITFCIMSNHFHILVEVPRRPEVLPGDDELIALIRETQGNAAADTVAHWFERWSAQGNRQAIDQERERWFAQMWDVSRFMKVLKQRFSQWFNGRGPVRRKGTLWEERFRSVLVESGEALQTMAAYIDLNPVRAGLVDDPKDYRWCGYGEACAGRPLAQAGVLRAARSADPTCGTVTADPRTGAFDFLSWYREQLFGRGFETHDPEGRVRRLGFSAAQIDAVRDARGRLPRHVYLRLRVRYFTDGAVLGSKAFVEGIFHARRDLFSAKRLTASRRLKGLDFHSPLRTARALVINPTG
jgi:REP element-mobilizing transposase RayT